MLILDLCGGTGAWSRPFSQTPGYDVRVITLPEHDVRTWVPPAKADIILCAPPCTEFSLAKTGERDFAAALPIVDACLRIVWRCRPSIWALENPHGLLTRWLGPPRHTFNPCDYGDPYTKLTNLWGEFTIPTPNPVEPLHDLKDVAKTAFHRSITPPGFAEAFFWANNPTGGHLFPVEQTHNCLYCGEPINIGLKLTDTSPRRRRDVKTCRQACRQAMSEARKRGIPPEQWPANAGKQTPSPKRVPIAPEGDYAAPHTHCEPAPRS